MQPYYKKQNEVDQRVFQELKNYQTSLSDINQRLGGLNSTLIELTKKHDTLLAKFGSETKSMEISMDQFYKRIKEELLKFFLILEEYRERLKKQDDRIENIEKHVHEFLDDHQTQESISRIESTLRSLDDVVLSCCLQSTERIHDLKTEMQSQMHVLKQEFEEKTPDISPLKQSLDSRMDTMYGDFRGLVREIQLCKNALAYDEKKFENIYTLIQRLKDTNESVR